MLSVGAEAGPPSVTVSCFWLHPTREDTPFHLVKPSLAVWRPLENFLAHLLEYCFSAIFALSIASLRPLFLSRLAFSLNQSTLSTSVTE